MKWIDYREKLGIGFNDEQKFNMMKNKVTNFISEVIGNSYSEKSYLEYCMMTGTAYDDYNQAYRHLESNIGKAKSISELIAKYIAFYNTYQTTYDYYSTHIISKSEVLAFLKKCLNDLNILFEIIEDEDGLFVFPKGARELDDALVSEPLEWLNKYPQTKREWIDALKSYSTLTDNNASDVADKFRKALERFLQEFFNSTKTLENLKSEYGRYLKGKNIPTEISNNFEALYQAYTNYMNGYAKHQNRTNKNVLEYLMYQTGNIIRLLITLEEEK